MGSKRGDRSFMTELVQWLYLPACSKTWTVLRTGTAYWPLYCTGKFFSNEILYPAKWTMVSSDNWWQSSVMKSKKNKTIIFIHNAHILVRRNRAKLESCVTVRCRSKNIPNIKPPTTKQFSSPFRSVCATFPAGHCTLISTSRIFMNLITFPVVVFRMLLQKPVKTMRRNCSVWQSTEPTKTAFTPYKMHEASRLT